MSTRKEKIACELIVEGICSRFTLRMRNLELCLQPIEGAPEQRARFVLKTAKAAHDNAIELLGFKYQLWLSPTVPRGPETKIFHLRSLLQRLVSEVIHPLDTALKAQDDHQILEALEKSKVAVAGILAGITGKPTALVSQGTRRNSALKIFNSFALHVLAPIAVAIITLYVGGNTFFQEHRASKASDAQEFVTRAYHIKRIGRSLCTSVVSDQQKTNMRKELRTFLQGSADRKSGQLRSQDIVTIMIRLQRYGFTNHFQQAQDAIEDVRKHLIDSETNRFELKSIEQPLRNLETYEKTLAR